MGFYTLLLHLILIACALNYLKSGGISMKPESHLMHFKENHFTDFFRSQGLSQVWSHFPYLETPYANVKSDLRKVLDELSNKNQVQRSPAFYGNMMDTYISFNLTGFSFL